MSNAADDSKLRLILTGSHRDGFQMWGCRGEGKGCKRNKYRTRKVQCEDCLGPLPEDMTVGELTERLRKGDA